MDIALVALLSAFGGACITGLFLLWQSREERTAVRNLAEDERAAVQQLADAERTEILRRETAEREETRRQERVKLLRERLDKLIGYRKDMELKGQNVIWYKNSSEDDYGVSENAWQRSVVEFKAISLTVNNDDIKNQLDIFKTGDIEASLDAADNIITRLGNMINKEMGV
jgi:hypothetical protein